MKKAIYLFSVLVLLLLVSVPVIAQNDKASELNKEQKEAARKKFQEDQLHNDWANFSRYRADNVKIGMPSNDEKRVVFMGNSITDGWIRIDSDFFKKNHYIDRGISGQTTPQMLVRFRPDVINLKASVVVILAGINDIAGNTGPSTLEMIEDNLSSMVEIAQANNVAVVLCSVLPAYDFPWRPGLEPAEKVVNLNAWIKNYAEAHKCTYVDYFTPMADEKHALKADLGTDGVHPNLSGYQIMEPLVQQAIQQALEIK